MEAEDIEIEPLFLDSPRGPLFAVFLHPVRSEGHSRIDTALLYLHPFGEEMHKSRRMAAAQGRRMAAAGCAVLQIDLTGCGDSVGDFGDASWSSWREDAKLAYAWLSAKTQAPIVLWGLRTGATLAVDVARELPSVRHLLLWQPATNGEMFLNQFLRIKLASEMLAEGKANSDIKRLRQQLAEGDGIEVGGNQLSADMARELAGLSLLDMAPPQPVSWLEVGARAGDHITPASQRVVERWAETGMPPRVRTIQGDPFWATQEITGSPALLDATMEEVEHVRARVD